jgi:hypothetical protein
LETFNEVIYTGYAVHFDAREVIPGVSYDLAPQGLTLQTVRLNAPELAAGNLKVAIKKDTLLMTIAGHDAVLLCFG